MQLRPRTTNLIHSPIGAALALLDLRTSDRPLLNMSQAAPSHAAPPAVIERVAQVAAEPSGGFYVNPQAGLPHLREAFATELSADHGAKISPGQILITAGCNQAFCLFASAIAEPGDNIILTTPFYFNHDMWLQVDGIEPRYLTTDADLLPDPDQARSLIDDRTRAIVIVTPGNPSGAIMPPATLDAFADLARDTGVALAIDETYRSFRGTDDPAHNIYAAPDWAEHVITLHSFSKEFAIPGYRVGAAVGDPALLAEMEKLLDCVAICAPRIGQEAAFAGLTGAAEWRQEKRSALVELHEHFRRLMATEPGGFELVSSGAYFGWIRHPHTNEATFDVVRNLVIERDILAIPGTAFLPSDEQMIRFSFANLAPAEIDEFCLRLAAQ